MTSQQIEAITLTVFSQTYRSSYTSWMSMSEEAREEYRRMVVTAIGEWERVKDE